LMARLAKRLQMAGAEPVPIATVWRIVIRDRRRRRPAFLPAEGAQGLDPQLMIADAEPQLKSIPSRPVKRLGWIDIRISRLHPSHLKRGAVMNQYPLFISGQPQCLHSRVRSIVRCLNLP
jgi:hypothetical protein